MLPVEMAFTTGLHHRRDPCPAGPGLPTRNDRVGLIKVIADQAEVQVPALRPPIGSPDPGRLMKPAQACRTCMAASDGSCRAPSAMEARSHGARARRANEEQLPPVGDRCGQGSCTLSPAPIRRAWSAHRRQTREEPPYACPVQAAICRWMPHRTGRSACSWRRPGFAVPRSPGSAAARAVRTPEPPSGVTVDLV
jgi:hypothetical protein